MMKKYLNVLIGFAILIGSGFSQKNIYKYSVEVRNKTVYARVFLNGKLVDNLTKDDFILFENGKKVKIDGVDIVRKKFGEEEIGAQKEEKKISQPRFFILTFKIIDYGDYLERGINYLFDRVFRENDKLMFLSEHHYFIEDNLKNKKRVKKKIIRILKRESVLSRMRLNKIISRLQSLTKSIEEVMNFGRMNSFSMSSRASMDFEKLERTVERFLSFLREYKIRYLTPEIDRFYYFSEYIKGVKLKKWVINFYQFEKIPIPSTIKDFMEKFTGGNAEDVYSWATAETKTTRMITALEKELNQPESFPADEVARLFYKGDTTFYTILLNKTRDSGDKDFYYKNIYTDLEKALKEISFSTGGDVLLSNNVVKTFEEFKKKEDIIYLINYTPTAKNPKIKIKMKDPRYKVKYDPEQFSDFIERYLNKKRKENPEILINKFKFSDNTLHFSIKDFKMKKEGRKNMGKILVILKITDENGKTVYNAQKQLIARNNSIKIEIKLTTLKPNFYYLYLDAYDLFTNKMSSRFEIIEIK